MCHFQFPISLLFMQLQLHKKPKKKMVAYLGQCADIVSDVNHKEIIYPTKPVIKSKKCRTGLKFTSS